MARSTDSLSGVPRTLLIPLAARALAAECYPDLGFRDPDARRILDQLDPGARAFEHDAELIRPLAVRAREIDRMAREFFARNPDGLGVSLGAGLCTRFNRIDNGRLRWFDLDLPEVVAIRRALTTPHPRLTLAEGSMLEPGWLDACGWQAPRPVFVIIEGVLMYFTKGEVAGLLRMLRDRFSSHGEIAFDFVHPWLVKVSTRLPGIRRTGARFAWGARDTHAIERLEPGLRCVEPLPLSRLGGSGGLALLGSGFFRLMSRGDEAYWLGRFRFG